MTATAINTKYVEIVSASKSNHAYLSAGFEGLLAITSKLDDIGIRKDEKIVIAKTENKDLRFLGEGTITKVEKRTSFIPPLTIASNKTISSPVRTIYTHNFRFQIKHSLQKNNLLSDLEYSLKEIFNYNNPLVHFQQQTRKLSEDDYETIINGWIYAARTVFGKLVNSIPRQNKLEFMLQAMDKFQTVDFTKVNLIEGLYFLYEYIDNRILSRGRLLIETNNLIKSHLSNIVPFDEIGFINPKNGKSNMLHSQAEIFEKIFAIESQKDFKKFINRGIKENGQQEQRFKEIFKRQTWPIDLRT